MNHTEQFQAMEKLASPRWAKMLKRLSPVAQKRLAAALPEGVTRVVGKELGRGVEGRVFPSFTGGQGHTATKVFNDRPAFLKFPDGDYAPAPWTGKITGGSGGIKKVFGGVPIAERVALMKQHPNLFPKVFGTNPRGFTVERLSPIKETGAANTRDMAKRWIQDIRTQQFIVDNFKTRLALNSPRKPSFWDWVRKRPQATPSPGLELEYKKHVGDLEAAKSMMRRYYQHRNVGLASPAHPVHQVDRKLSQASGTASPISNGGMGAKLDLNGSPIGVRDFGYFPKAQNPLHNIMRTEQGRAVISDPVPFKLPKPPSQSALDAWGAIGGNMTPSMYNAATVPY